MFGISNYATGYTYNRETLGDVSLFLPIALLALLLGGGAYMIYKRDKEEEEEEEEEISSGKKSIRALDATIKRIRANPEMLD